MLKTVKVRPGLTQIVFWGLLLTTVFLTSPSTAPFAAQADSDLVKADALWPKRADMQKTKTMIELYEKALADDPKNTEILWKLSRAYRWLGSHSPKEEKTAIFKKGVDFAKAGVELDDGCIPCRYWLGAGYGSYGLAKGILKSLSLIKPIKEEMNKVIAVDPGHAEGGAYMVLGRLYRVVPWFAGGDKEESEKMLKKAVEIGPKNFLNHYQLALTYLALKKRDEAKKELAWVMAQGVPSDPGEKEDQEDARRTYVKEFE